MSWILPAGPEDPRYRLTIPWAATAVDELRPDGAIRTRRTRLAEPLARALVEAGYTVEDWQSVLAATSITVTPDPDGPLQVTATVPRPTQVPPGELNPQATITVEYVGGASDGMVEPLTMDPYVPPDLAIAVGTDLYTRYGYDLGTGCWLYGRERGRVTRLTEGTPLPGADPEELAGDDETFGAAEDLDGLWDQDEEQDEEQDENQDENPDENRG